MNDIEKEKHIELVDGRGNFSANPFFLKNTKHGYNLFGVDYIPGEPSHNCFVFLQPIGTERNVIDAVQVNLARTLAANGTRVLRFDYYGTGDSEGYFEQINLDTMLSDIHSAVSYLLEKDANCQIGLFGLRFGALLASHYAEHYPKIVKNLILCAPVINAHEYIMNELRHSMSTQTVLFKKILMNRDNIVENLLNNKSTVVNGYDLSNMNGYTLTKQFFESFEKIEITKDKCNYVNNCLVIHIDKMKRKKVVSIEKVLEFYKNSEDIECRELIERAFPWIHGDYLYKIMPSLNSAVLEWIST